MVEDIKNRAQSLLESTGRAMLSVRFPRDFEVYFCSLELCSFGGELIDYFSFPVLPNSITKKEPYISNIKKTFGGVTIIKSSDFVPQEAILRGNFGRSFKVLAGKELMDFYGVIKYPDSEEYHKGSFSNIVKTGYGATKYLQGILERSKIFDGNSKQPRQLYLHNPTLGESYLVEPLQVQFEQSLGSNMMWNYTLNFSIVKSLDYGRMGSISGPSRSVINNKKSIEISALGSALGSFGSKLFR